MTIFCPTPVESIQPEKLDAIVGGSFEIDLESGRTVTVQETPQCFCVTCQDAYQPKLDPNYEFLPNCPRCGKFTCQECNQVFDAEISDKCPECKTPVI